MLARANSSATISVHAASVGRSRGSQRRSKARPPDQVSTTRLGNPGRVGKLVVGGLLKQSCFSCKFRCKLPQEDMAMLHAVLTYNS